MPPKAGAVDRRIRPITISERLVQNILADISAGELRIGDRLLPQRQLAQEMGISNNSVREALQVLQAMGVIEVRHGIGAFVVHEVDLSPITKEPARLPPITTEEYGKVLEARILLEPGIARLAACHIRNDELAEMTCILADMNASLKPEDPARYSSSDLKFHLLLADASANAYLSAFINSLESGLGKFLETIPFGDVGYIRHHVLLEALRQHDPVAATKAMVRLLESALSLSLEGNLIDQETHDELLDNLLLGPPGRVTSRSEPGNAAGVAPGSCTPKRPIHSSPHSFGGANMSVGDVPLPNVERCQAFWAREETDRPLLSAWVGSYETSALYARGLSKTPEGQIRPEDIVFERFRADYEDLFREHSMIPVDVPWAAFPLMVIPWVEAIAGCPILHRSGNCRAEHWLDSYDRLDELAIHEDWLNKLVDFTQWLEDLSAGRFPVALPLMRGPADALAAVRGSERSIFDLVDYPEQVDKALERLTSIWIRIASRLIDQIRPFANGYSFSVQNLWSPRPGGWFQDDALAYWSPKYYRRSIVHFEERLSTCMPATGIHLHPASLFTVEELVKMPSLGVIEVNVDDVGPRVPELMPHLQQIIASKRLLIWGAFSRDDLLLIRGSLPTRGLALQVMGETPEQVQDIIAQVESIWRANHS